MTSVRIKLCGITNRDDALSCAEAGADYLGFIFYRGSPRYIEPARASEIVSALPPGVTPVGVFVNETPEAIERAALDSGVRLVQLSGDEPPETSHRVTFPVIQVFRPAGTRAGAAVAPPSAYRLFASMVDGAPPGTYGGSGAGPDVDFAGKLAATGRLFLAGGLRGDNVAGLISRVRPFAVDACSSTELRPGRKDRDLVTRFCTNVRNSTNL